MPVGTDEDDFKKQLRSAPSKPSSPAAGYLVAAAVAIVGVVSIFGAKSRPIFISGFLIVAAAAFIAWRTRSANKHWR